MSYNASKIIGEDFVLAWNLLTVSSRQAVIKDALILTHLWVLENKTAQMYINTPETKSQLACLDAITELQKNRQIPSDMELSKASFQLKDWGIDSVCFYLSRLVFEIIYTSRTAVA